MLRSRLTLLAATGALMIAVPAWADDKKDDAIIPGDFTATVALTSDYTFRGISQTDSGPAIQGAIDYSYMFNDAIGLYAGVWGSNVDFDDGDEANLELDLIAGLKGTISGFIWQAGVIYYAYPGAEVGGDKYDYVELAAKLGYDFDFVAITGGINYSADYFFETGDGLYLSADAAVPLKFLPYEIALAFHVGHQSIEENARFGAPDYYDWSIGVSGKVQGFTLALTYVDTDIDKSECFPGSGLTKTCEGRVVVSVARSF
jgi:uncharacterized protein (TIGR02001 family)